MLTRIIKYQDTFVIYIPKELAFVDASQEVEVERVGGTIVIRPVSRERLGDLLEVFASFPPSFMAEGRETHDQDERDRSWSEPRTDER